MRYNTVSQNGSSAVNSLENYKMIRPLSQFLGITDHESYVKMRGIGNRKYRISDNLEETFKHDFIHKVLEKIQARRSSRDPKRKDAVSSPIRESVMRKECTPEKSVVEKVGICVVCAKQYEIPESENQEQEEGFDVVDRKCCSSKLIASSELNFSHQVEKSLGDRYLDSTTQRKEFRDQSSQTDCDLSESFKYEVRPKDEYAGCDEKTNSKLNAPKTEGVSSTTSNLYIPPCRTRSETGEQMNASSINPPTPLLPTPPSIANVEVSISEYEKAKMWKPKNKDQLQALEQTKKDLYQVLIVGKGCKYKSIMSEFKRVTQEELDLGKIGVPDIKTLLVQMEDLIYLKRDNSYFGQVYVFANRKAKMFEKFVHIAELVSEQRDNNNIIPDPGLLINYHIKELFEPRQDYQNYSSTYYGSYRNPWPQYYSYPNYQGSYSNSYQQSYSQQYAPNYFQNNPYYNQLLNQFSVAAAIQQRYQQRNF